MRTLHHYDAEGIVVPSARTHAGSRIYTMPTWLVSPPPSSPTGGSACPSPEVRALLDGDGSAREHLRRQRDAVSRLGELEQLVAAIDRPGDGPSDPPP